MRQKQKQVMVRLSDAEVAALGVLTGGASREEWIRAQIRGAITRRLMINEAAITQFHQLAGKRRGVLMMPCCAVTLRESQPPSGEKAENLALIAEYESEKAILYGAMGGV